MSLATDGFGTITAGTQTNQGYASDLVNLAFFGDGSDGDLTVSSGTTTLTRPMYYRNLTVNGTGQINTAGFEIYVSVKLDLRGAPANAITRSGVAGNSATSFTGGAQINSTLAGTLPGSSVAVAGGTGTTTTGGNGTSSSGNITRVVNSNAASAAGAGGSGSSGSGGNGSIAPTVTGTFTHSRITTSFLFGNGIATLAPNSLGGGAGGGDSVNKGGGGGSGGQSGSMIAIFAASLQRDGTTSPSAISCTGATAGNGFTPTLGNCGGGGGGSGGHGGYIYMVVGTLLGSPATNMVDVSGGNGGNGAAGIGSGTAGIGGQGGAGGRFTFFNVGTNTSIDQLGSAGTAASGVTGGPGATSKFTI